MTITLEHQRQWCAEAVASLTTEGWDHGVQWRIGPAPEKHSGTYADSKPVMSPPITHCAVCTVEIGAGQTVVQTLAKETYGWRCVGCFDWSLRGGLEGTRSSRRPTGPGYSRVPTIAAAAKALVIAAQTAPRFKVTKPETFTDDKKLAPLVAAVIVASGTTAQPSPAKKETKTMPKAKPVIAHAQEISVLAEHTARPPIRPTHEAPKLPQWATDWLGQLVYEAKRDYARQYLAHILCGADVPADPGAEWADKARKRADRLAEKAA